LDEKIDHRAAGWLTWPFMRRRSPWIVLSRAMLASRLYYSKDFMASGVWKLPLAGGEETLVLDQPEGGFYGYWDLVEKGIYYYNADTKDIEFFDFATKHVSTAVTPVQPPIPGNPGFSVSPDRRWILFAQKDQDIANIMVVDNFRR
jgi:hypothetical protein